MKLVSKIKNEHGSTLAMLLIVMTILIMLGTALVSATYVGFTMKMHEHRQKTAFYVAEAGLDEVYAYLGEEVENAVQYSKNVVVATELMNHPEYSILNESEYNTTLRNHFVTGYQRYFDLNRNEIENRMNTMLISRNLALGVSTESIGAIEARIVRSFSDSGFLEVEFVTKVRKKDIPGNDTNMFQTLEATLRVDIPNYETPYIHTMNRLEIERNALFDQAIAVDGNFYAYDGAVTVEGNLFAHGLDSNQELLDPTTVGGIFLGGKDPIDGARKSGDLTVMGDLSTERYVRINSSTSGDDSKLVVNNDLFCNSLVIADTYENSANTAGRISINGNASVMDDTELNANESEITINGNYFGFSDGASSTENHDQSSSVVINTEELGTGKSKLILNGNGSVKRFPDGTTAANGVYIAGTVYVDNGRTYEMHTNPAYGTVTLLNNGNYVYRPDASSVGQTWDSFKVNATGYGSTKTLTVQVAINGMNEVFGHVGTNYQTGDSISIIGNYLAYGKVINQDSSWYKSTQDYNAFNNLPEDYFDSFEPLDVVRWKNPGKVEMNVDDKAVYSNYVYEQEPAVFLLGDEGVILRNVVYSLGTYMAQNGIFNELKYDRPLTGSISLALDKLEKEYFYRVRNMGDAQTENYLNETFTLYGGIKSWIRNEWSNTSGGLNIVKQPSSTDMTLHYVKNRAGANGNEAVILVGENADLALLNSLKTQLSGAGRSFTEFSLNGPVNGLILAHSDIYCLGTISYTGLIATEGNMVCLDQRLKSFKNTGTSQVGNYVTDLAFRGIAEVGRNTEPGFWFRQDDVSWDLRIEKLVKGTEIPVENGTTGFIGSTNNVIRITRWEKTDEPVNP